MIEVTLTKEHIELYALLKLESLAASGGEAKYFIADGQVRVNGEVETRKRNKIVAGDKVEFAGETLVVNGIKGQHPV